MMIPWFDIHISRNALRFFLPIFILSLILHPKIVISLTNIDPHYVMYNCENTDDRYVSGSAFESALNDTLFSKLPIIKASQATFSNFTNGTGIDQVNALFYCRADVGSLVCHDCVMSAVDKITEQCRFSKEAIVWFEECTLRYSNRSIFSIDQETPLFTYINSTGIINDNLLDPFKVTFDSAMNGLVQQAAYSKSLQGFATTEVNISSTDVLRCVVQCSPDIIGTPCDRCLRSALNQRDKWADTMIFMPSCFLRVDLYRSTILLNPSPPPPPRKKVVIIVGASLVSVAIIATILASVHYRRLCNRPASKGIKGLRVFCYAELSAATGRFNKDNYLGKGGYGEVYKGVIRRRGVELEIAVKRLNQKSYHGKQDFLSEMKSNSCARHENVISLLGFCSERKHKLLVHEFMARNCLYKNLHGEDATRKQLTPENRIKIALGTAKGLKYLHDECVPKIIHRDVKSANILLDTDFVPKVADFGLARIFPDGASHVTTEAIGTPNYLDPHYDNSKKLTEKTDVYSFGIVLLELITGWTSTRLSHLGMTNMLLQAITNSRFADLIDPQLKTEDNQVDHNNGLMARMIICAAFSLHPSPEGRLKMSEIVKLLEVGSLQAEDVADMVAFARSDPASSTASTTRPDTYELEDLRRLAVQLHNKRNRVAPLERNSILERYPSNEISNRTTTSFKSMDSNNSLE